VPLLFAPFVGFLLGISFAWAARADLSKIEGPLLLARPVVISAAFAAFLYAPLCGYFVAFHGDWAYLYTVDWEQIPSAVDLALVLVSGASVPLGTLAAWSAARGRKLSSVARIAAAPSLVTLGLLAWGAKRLAVSATYAQFHGEFGVEPIAASTLGRGVLWMGLVAALGIAWSVRTIGPRRPA
jgi:hypothetical protein